LSEVGQLKVGHILSSITGRGGGVVEAVKGLSSALNRNHDASVIVYGGAQRHETTNVVDGWEVETIRQFEARFGSYSYMRGCNAAVVKDELAILHIHGLWQHSSMVAMSWHRRTKRDFFVSVHGMLDPWAMCESRKKKYVASYLFQRETLNRAACIHALSEAELRDIRDYGIRTPVAIVPNGVMVPEVTNVTTDWQRNIHAYDNVLLFLGRVHEKKGIEPLLRGWKLAQNFAALSNWHLVIAGWGDAGYRAKLVQLVHQLGIVETVHFVGPQFNGDKVASFHRANAFILPSFSEGLPVAVLEASAFGLPSIVSPECNFSGSPLQESLVSVDPESTKSIARGIQSVASLTDQQRVTLGAASKGLINEHFSLERISSQMMSIYSWVLGKESKPEFVIVD
jgi:glycosyltransferase involved in cell wall biosynthesis